MLAPSIGPCERCKVDIRLGITESLYTVPRLLGRAVNWVEPEFETKKTP